MNHLANSLLANKFTNSVHRAGKQERLGKIFCYFFAIFILCQEFSLASEFEDAFLSDRNGRKNLYLTSEVVAALEIAKLEAQKQNVNFNLITRYAIFFSKESMKVALSPPYIGLDGPEFIVEMQRINLKVINVTNKLVGDQQ